MINILGFIARFYNWILEIKVYKINNLLLFILLIIIARIVYLLKMFLSLGLVMSVPQSIVVALPGSIFTNNSILERIALATSLATSVSVCGLSNHRNNGHMKYCCNYLSIIM